jgi:hypothetical protein
VTRTPRLGHRKDKNHAEVVELFLHAGLEVLDLSAVGGGVPDVLLGKRDRLVLVEVKIAKGKLTPEQEAFHQKWPVRVVRSLEDAMALVRSLIGGTS